MGFRLVALLSPEHGLEGESAAGDRTESRLDSASGLPVYSLYGETRKPTREMLRDIEVLVFDIQDIGVRFYTYISTLKLAMEAAAEAGIEFVVLDRPNPNTGTRVEGPVLDPKLQSFIGVAPIALLHGMTVGELALMFNGEAMLEGGIKVDLEIVPARGWRRSMWWEDTGLPWRPTSPNIRTPEAATTYAAMGLFEGINVSEGRGTAETFLIAGAPWIRGEALVSVLERLALPGISIRTERFTPRSIPAAPKPSFLGESCHGFRLQVTGRHRFEAVRTGLSALAAIRRMYPDESSWEKVNGVFVIDQLLGTDLPRTRLEAGASVESILVSFAASLEEFQRRRQRYLLYR
jgi:uncharacterized protein YbbC (DUF1343 family)